MKTSLITERDICRALKLTPRAWDDLPDTVREAVARGYEDRAAMLAALTAAEDRLATLIDAEEATKADEKALREVRAAIRAAKGEH